VNHMAFSQVILQQLDGTFALEREDKEVLVVQWFHEQRLIWKRAGGARRLRQKAYDILNQVARLPVAVGKDDVAPSIYGDSHFLTSVVNELKCNLPSNDEYKILDDDTRYLLMFKCGRLMDCRTGLIRFATPADRISKHTGYNFPHFHNDELKTLIHKTVTCLNSFWDECDGEFKPVYDEPTLQPLLNAMLEKSPAYQVFFGLFEDHDMALWLMKQTARAAAGMAFEEFLYMTNSSGQNGKGMWIKLMTKLLGSGPDNYFHTLEFSKHFVGKSKPGNNPEVAECEGKRFVAVNESPDMTASRELNVELIKQLAVGGDNPVTAMGKYKDPSLFNPQMLLSFFAQDPPVFPNKDGGLRSRLSYLLMPFVFVKNPQPDTNERKLDTSIKENIGDLVPELLVWIPLLTQGLIKMLRLSRVIVPRPPKVVEDTDAQYITAEAPPKPLQEIAIEYADEHLCEWKLERTQMPYKVPANRTEICQHFAIWAAKHKYTVNSREAMLKILSDYRANASGSKSAYKQSLPKEWNIKDISVFKGGFNEGGLLGRPGWQLMPQKTVTIVGWPFAERSS
jgi:hypothetical protein